MDITDSWIELRSDGSCRSANSPVSLLPVTQNTDVNVNSSV